MSSYSSIPSEKLSRLIGVAHAPARVDVRIDVDRGADPRAQQDGEHQGRVSTQGTLGTTIKRRTP